MGFSSQEVRIGVLQADRVVVDHVDEALLDEDNWLDEVVVVDPVWVVVPVVPVD